MQVTQRPRANLLRLQRNSLTLPQSLTTPAQSLRPTEKLLPLLELVIRGRVIGVAVPEKGAAVVGEGGEFSLQGVDVGAVVAVARVYGGFEGGGDLRFFELELAELLSYSVSNHFFTAWIC